MARRRVVYPVDTSDWMANIVLGFLVVAAVALVVLILFMDSEGEEIAAQNAATEVPGGAATVVPSPTATPTAGDGGAVVDEPDEPDEPVVRRTTEADTEVPPASEPVTPLRPRGQRSEPTETGAPAPPVAGEPDAAEPATDEADAGEPQPEEPAPGDDSGQEPVEPGADAPAGASSPLDDPDRVPTLILSDAPLDVHTVLADLDGDDVPERVWAALVRNAVQLRVQRDDTDGGWTDTATTTGAVADDLVSVEVEDLTGDGRPEIHTRQWVGVNGESVSLWSFSDDRLRPMTASGGCWDGENTLGVVGARVDPGLVVAICEEDPLPPYLWSTAVYRWVDGMWTFERRVGVYG